MNRALWRKAISDARWHLAISAAVLIVFSWAFIWLMRQFPPQFFGGVLRFMPDFLKALVPVPVELLDSRLGQVSVLYVHLVTLLVCLGWALGRGTASVSAEIGRGNMELLVSLPVRRASLILVPAVVASIGAALLALSLWLGSIVALLTVGLEEPVAPTRLLPGVINLFAMTYCVTGLTTFVSSWQNDRWRAIAISGGIVLLAFMLEVIRRLWRDGWWLKYVNFLSAFQPQDLILLPEASGRRAWILSGVLLGLGSLGFAAAAAVFSYRDVPAGR